MYRKDRQHEFYTTLAQKEGYPARSVYKLKEIDEKFRIIKKNNLILDLGAAPGSWLMYISQKIGNEGKVVGVDLEEIKIPRKTNMLFIKKSAFDLDETDFRYKFHAIVSDLAPNTTGIKSLDSARSLELVEKSFEVVRLFLLPGGHFVCKIFENELSDQFIKKLKNYFDSVKRIKPKAVVKKSKEFYIVAKGLKKFQTNQ